MSKTMDEMLVIARKDGLFNYARNRVGMLLTAYGFKMLTRDFSREIFKVGLEQSSQLLEFNEKRFK